MAKCKRLDNLSRNEICGIINMILDGKNTSKEIARKFNIDPGNVTKLARANGLTLSKPRQQTTEMHKEENVMKVRKPETVVLDSEKHSNKSIRYTEEEKLETLSALEDAMKQPKFKFKNYAMSINIAPGTLRKWAAEIGLDVSKEAVKAAAAGNVVKEEETIETKDPDNKDDNFFTAKEFKSNYPKSKAKTVLNKAEKTSNGCKAHRGGLVLNYINTDDNTVKASLFEGRHDFPANVACSIFKEQIEQDDMFNYTSLNTVVEEFLLQQKVIDSKNKPIKDLEVYVSGYVPASTAVISVCAKYNVNLSFYHYDTVAKIYRKQDVLNNGLNNFSNPNLDHPFVMFAIAKQSFDSIYCYNCNLEDITTDGKEYYLLEKMKYENMYSKVPFFSEYFLVKNFEDIWKVFGVLAVEAEDSKHSAKIRASRIKINNDTVSMQFISDFRVNWKYTGGVNNNEESKI